MTTPGSLWGLLLGKLETACREAVQAGDPLLLGLATWLRIADPESRNRLNELASKVGVGVWDYRNVALHGFAMGSIATTDEQKQAFERGVEWLIGRHFFVPGQPPTIESDTTAILGLALGLRATGHQSGADWLLALVSESARRASKQSWDSHFLNACALLLVTLDKPSEGDFSDEIGPALASRGCATITPEQERRAVERIASGELSCEGERALFQLASVRWLLRTSANALPGRATVDDVVRMLESVSHALKKWSWELKPRTTGAGAVAEKWDIQNEYHVQNLLWAILAPVFQDLEDEEYLRSIGHKHARVDLAIPSLRLIIEVKIVRDSTTSAFSGIIGEIAEDTGLYLSNNRDYTSIVVFVWDNARATEQHTELLNGLHKLNGVHRAVVVPRPGSWIQPADQQS